jgi:hypothetical protein
VIRSEGDVTRGCTSRVCACHGRCGCGLLRECSLTWGRHLVTILRFIRQVRGRTKGLSYRRCSGHGNSTTAGHASWDIASSLLMLLVDGRPVVLGGWVGQERGNLGLDLCLLSQERL